MPFVFGFAVYQAFYDPQIVELGKAYLSYLQGDEFLPGLSVLAIGYNNPDKVFIGINP